MKHTHIFHDDHYYETFKSGILQGAPYSNCGMQRGGGLLSSLSKYALPVLKKYVYPKAKEAVINTVSDVANNRSSLKQAIKNNSILLAQEIGKNLASELVQKGGGRPRKRKAETRSVLKKKKEKSNHSNSSSKRSKTDVLA